MINLRVYQVYLNFIEFVRNLLKKSLLKSQLGEDKWTRELVRINELTLEFDKHDHIF